VIPRWYREERRKQHLASRPESSRARTIRLERERRAWMCEAAAWGRLGQNLISIADANEQRANG
jgi:hypothetical protein